MPERQFKLRAADIRPLAPDRGGCFATNSITVDGRRVGYLSREPPDGAWDSGWRFFAGDDADVNDPDNVTIYDVNIIANYDPDIVPLLDSPVGSAFARSQTGEFVAEAYDASDHDA